MEIKLILELVPLYQLMLVNAEEKKMNRLSEQCSSGYLCMIYSACSISSLQEFHLHSCRFPKGAPLEVGWEPLPLLC